MEVTNDQIIRKAAEGFAEAIANNDGIKAERYAEAASSARLLASRGIAVRLQPDGTHEESTDA
jgi:hypothetical protein